MYLQTDRRSQFAATEDSLVFPKMIDVSSKVGGSTLLKKGAVFAFHVHDSEGLFFQQPLDVVEVDGEWELLESLQGSYRVDGLFLYRGEKHPALLTKTGECANELRLQWPQLTHAQVVELEDLSDFGTVGVVKKSPSLLAAEDFTVKIQAGMFVKGALRDLGVVGVEGLEANPLRTSSALLEWKGRLAIGADYLHIGQCNTLPSLKVH